MKRCFLIILTLAVFLCACTPKTAASPNSDAVPAIAEASPFQFGLIIDTLSSAAGKSAYSSLRHLTEDILGGRLTAALSDLSEYDMLASARGLIDSGCTALAFICTDAATALNLGRLCQDNGVYWCVFFCPDAGLDENIYNAELGEYYAGSFITVFPDISLSVLEAYAVTDGSHDFSPLFLQNLNISVIHTSHTDGTEDSPAICTETMITDYPDTSLIITNSNQRDLISLCSTLAAYGLASKVSVISEETDSPGELSLLFDEGPMKTMICASYVQIFMAGIALANAVDKGQGQGRAISVPLINIDSSEKALDYSSNILNIQDGIFVYNDEELKKLLSAFGGDCTSKKLQELADSLPSRLTSN